MTRHSITTRKLHLTITCKGEKRNSPYKLQGCRGIGGRNNIGGRKQPPMLVVRA